MEKLHKNKRILGKEILVLEEKGWVGGKKQRQLGDGWNKHHWEEMIIGLADVEVIGSTWRETRRLKRINMTISIVEKDWYSHRSMRIPLRKKVWNQHLTSKQLEYHNSKQKQRVGLQNKPEQTYDRDFVRSFRGGAYTGSIVQHHHVQGSAHDIRSVLESA